MQQDFFLSKYKKIFVTVLIRAIFALLKKTQFFMNLIQTFDE